MRVMMIMMMIVMMTETIVLMSQWCMYEQRLLSISTPSSSIYSSHPPLPLRHLKTVSSKIGVEGIHNINNDAEIIELNLMKDFYFNCQLTKDLVTVTVKFVS